MDRQNPKTNGKNKATVKITQRSIHIHTHKKRKREQYIYYIYKKRKRAAKSMNKSTNDYKL